MARKVVAMGDRLLAVLTTDVSSVDVSALCRELGISRQSFYKWRRRFAEEGPAGLVERSRRPLSSPNQMSAGTEDRIVQLRKERQDAGEDCGAQSIVWQMAREGWPEVPSVSAAHRALVRRGQVAAQPKKRPRSATRRFVWPFPNDAWQIDATRWVLSGGGQVWIMDCLDDHSRVVPAAAACAGPTSQVAWDTLCAGAERWGLPARVMSDNGACFTGRLLWGGGGRVLFEENLAAVGIGHILSSPGHPQTCGKLERFHQTLKQWLRARPLVATITELQTQLDEFLDSYNTRRPHRALVGATPSEAWHATAATRPGHDIATPADANLHTVDSHGRITVGSYVIGIGTHLAGHELLVIRNRLDLTVIGQGRVIRRFRVDPTRRYQPSGRPPGPRPHHQIRPCT